MKTIGLSLALFLATILTAIGGPKLDTVLSIRVRDSKSNLVCVLQEPTKIDALLSCFRRANEVGISSDRNAFPYKITISSLWLYDPDRGEFMLLSKAEQPVFRLSDSDRALVNTLILLKAPIQDV